MSARIVNYDSEVAPFAHELRVVGYDKHNGAHVCEIKDVGRKVFVDLLVGGDLQNLHAEDLIGKTVRVKSTYGYVFIADGVSVADAEAA